MRAKTSRLQLIDGLRGLAVAMMLAYHFCYDLVWFGWAQWRMLEDPAWIGWRNVIVSSFLLLVGVSLALRQFFQVEAQDFWKRWRQIAAAALLVSLGS
ncbi:MAG: heparan-alpha-glucosaminide N-acetyltransferase domain-containing protein, partial [Burkholderiales bacterium]